MQPYPKRLIEVDLPIKRISAHARREKSIRHGHISTLHIWWARRPLAACRAVMCASLWPDPADPNCPQSFRDAAAKIIQEFARATQSNRWGAEICDNGSFSRYMRLAHNGGIDPSNSKGQVRLRAFLLDFIADFASWDASANHWFLDTARALTQAAHEALGGEKGTRPLVVDPFAGGGAIPLEALRIGAEAFASDLNPVAVLLNRVVLEYIPKDGQGLANEVRKWGRWIKKEAEKELSTFYPRDPDGATPVAYLWARTMRCEGPGCGAEVPLIRSLLIVNKDDKRVALRLVPDKARKSVRFELLTGADAKTVGSGVVRRGSVTCPCCEFTTKVASVRSQLKARNGGSHDARLLAVVLNHPRHEGKSYRLPMEQDHLALTKVGSRFDALSDDTTDGLSAIPDEPCPPEGALGFRFQKYGITSWRHLYTQRQSVALATFAKLIHALPGQLKGWTRERTQLLQTCMSLALGRVNDLSATLCRWLATLEAVAATNGAQNKMPMVLDFVEANPLGGAGGDWDGQIDWIARVIDHLFASRLSPGAVQRSPAQCATLPEDSAHALVTDPPYYNAFGYSDLSEFFFIWLRRAVPQRVFQYTAKAVPKLEEAISIGAKLSDDRGEKTDTTYTKDMTDALSVGRVTVRPDGIGVVVFANKTTRGWEAILQAIVDAGWCVTASWPIETERPTRQRAIGSAALQSSVHLVCRPRETSDGKPDVRTGDWRDVLSELPIRTREWMRRLADEGVVGADAIFACLGPALEIFSRYSRVEKASGEPVLLKEYLTYVWGAVAQEALTQIFKEADATGFEEDARLTAMWLWTLNAGSVGQTNGDEAAIAAEDVGPAEETDADDEEGESNGKPKGGGYILEFDAARKIAQGLGAHLEDLQGVIEVKGDKARLLSVPERTRRLFGKDEAEAPQAKRKKKDKQMKLFSLEEVESEEGGWGDKSVPKLGDTTLDRVHQSMILFAAGRGEALRRFLTEDGAGRDQRFWKLANALSALYPQGTDEKRWVDGVLARKKGLGL